MKLGKKGFYVTLVLARATLSSGDVSSLDSPTIFASALNVTVVPWISVKVYVNVYVVPLPSRSTSSIMEYNYKG